MLQDWEQGFVGNNPGTISGLPRRETLAQVLVRSFRPIQAWGTPSIKRRRNWFSPSEWMEARWPGIFFSPRGLAIAAAALSACNQVAGRFITW